MDDKLNIRAIMVLKDIFKGEEIKAMVNDEQRTFRQKRTSPKGVKYNMMVSKMPNGDYAVWATKSEITMQRRANFVYTDGKWHCPFKNHHIEIVD